MKVKEFEIEESKVNKGCLNLIAIAENGEKYVVSGDYHSSPYLIPYDRAWDTSELHKK